jgi:hypothetical protein
MKGHVVYKRAMNSEEITGGLPLDTRDANSENDALTDQWDSLSEFSDLSRSSFVSYLPPAVGTVVSVPKASLHEAMPKREPTTTMKFANGRMGCKQLALVKRLQRQKRGLTEDDEEDEVEIVEPPAKMLCVDISPGKSSHEEEVNVVGVIEGVQFPHPRHGCTKNPFRFFDSSSWQDRTESNMDYCEKCYCFVCEVPAKSCPEFKKHCHANDRDDMKSYWQYMRHQQTSSEKRQHLRFDCPRYMFRPHRRECPWPVEIWKERAWLNKQHCQECLCYLCDLPVTQCKHWPEHCNANLSDVMASFWRHERKRLKSSA